MIQKVEFPEQTIDVAAEAERRILTQFQAKCLIVDTISAEITQIQDLNDAEVGVLIGRTIAEAVGDNLDVIGDIVGQDRLIKNRDIITYLKSNQAVGVNNYPVFMTGGILARDGIATDAEFRVLIISKIFKNHTQAGSIPEILNFVKLVYDINISVRQLGLMDITIIVPAGTKESIILTLISQISTTQTDHQYFLPIPTCVRIVNLEHRPAGALQANNPATKVNDAPVGGQFILV